MYRGLKKLEITAMRRSLDYWGAFGLSQEFDFVVRQGEKNGLFAVTPEVKYYVIGREPEPVFAGLYLGSLGKKALVLSMEGAYLVASVSDKKKIKVTGQGRVAGRLRPGRVRLLHHLGRWFHPAERARYHRQQVRRSDRHREGQVRPRGPVPG